MAKSKKVIRKHEVRAELSVPELTKTGTGLKLEIYVEGEKIGTLSIGRGSLAWVGARRKTRKQISWSAFAKQMDYLAYGD